MHQFCLIFLLFLSVVNSQNAVCDAIPYNTLTNCNLTCATCSGKDTCKTCPSYLVLSSTTCRANASDRITYNQYFYSQNLKYDKALLNFTNSTTNLSSNNVFRFCINGSYKFDIVGLFRGQDNLIFTQTYNYQMSEIALNFRIFFTKISSALLKVQLNGKQAYSASLSAGFTSTFNLTTSSSWNYSIINENIQPYTDKIFIPLRTEMLSLNNKTAQIKITVQDQILTLANTNNTAFWGISQISVSAKKCRTCVSDSLKTLTGYLGIIVGISAAIVGLLVLLLHVYDKIKKENIRKKNRERFKNSI